ncbi:disease resistance protein rga3-like [Trifolium pratense]|uniref:Disease resistance protein rga3-like n=1 Tax=Trifolium pratense TaxID=57577 RepID=A0A2K3LJJ3_TRIPR|nr:disease resistance protein rga3-like [Trifolium pratense]
MAESLLFALAESFITKLASQAVKEASLALGVSEELLDIKNTVSFMKAVLLDAELKQHQNNELREWLKQIKRIFSDAEDVIDDFECEGLRKQVASGSTRKQVRLLLVLDDVWNEDRVMWEELRGLIQAGAQGSKVLVTTRSNKVANMMGTYSSCNLQGLSGEDSLSVFVKWAFKEGEERKYPELMEIGKKIVLKCGGVPLALRTLGSSLFSKVDQIQEWMIVRDNEIWNLPQVDEDILPAAIKLSYDQLPSYLKQCFACFSLFEEDFHFNSCLTIVLWEALGFLPSPNQGEKLKDIGNRSLRSVSLHVVPNIESLSIDGCNKLNLSMGHDNQIAKLKLKLLHLESLLQLRRLFLSGYEDVRTHYNPCTVPPRAATRRQ